MSKNTKIAIAVIVIILIAIGIWLYVRSKNKKKPAQSSKTGTVTYSGPKIFPLIVGSRGDLVKQIQTKLNYVDPTANLVVDGVIGQNTADSLKTYADYPLTEDGYNTLMSL